MISNKYSVSIYWSDEDECFVALVPEFPGLSVFGETREEALKEAKIAINLFIDSYKEENKELPEERKINLRIKKNFCMRKIIKSLITHVDKFEPKVDKHKNK